jgi:hypothetical protein
LYNFLTKRLSQVPGINRTATSSMIRLVKREYAFPVPAWAEGQSVEPSKQADGRRRHRNGDKQRMLTEHPHAS